MELIEFMSVFFVTFGGIGLVDYDGAMELKNAPPSAGVTRENFARIEIGMTYDEVVAVFDAPGFRAARFEATATTGRCYDMYAWKGYGDYQPTVVFRDGRVFHKLDEYPEGPKYPTDAEPRYGMPYHGGRESTDPAPR
ncbi:MAG: hypothetical protein JSU81_04420 [Candidatus Coatesbacteria bacterium]|nr:MAG: hypothetical protein JSU81_04420 [Candidatus Coatesbacteria bacterium]